MACGLIGAGVLAGTAVAGAAPGGTPGRPAVAPVLDLETLTAPQAKAMLESGEVTSVQLTRAYLARIEALNKSGPGLNAVSQLNPLALREAAQADRERAQGIVRGPAHGLPLLMKDLIDVKGMYTSAGNYSLRRSFPHADSGVTEKLRAAGVVILGKTGLSEYANFFGRQPSGFANLTGQVLNGLDADQNPSGSSSGTGSAAAAGLSLLTIGTETSGSILSPSRANGLVGLRPTIGLVPGVGIAPIMASQDTAGPMDRTVANAAFTLQAIAGPDPESSYAGLWDPRPDGDPSITPEDPKIADSEIVPPLPEGIPDYLSALDLDYVRGKRVGYNGDVTSPGPLKEAYDALVAAGATMVEVPVINPLNDLPPAERPGSVFFYEAKRDINRYYRNLGPDAPIRSLDEEIATNEAESAQALKFGNATHFGVNQVDISPGSPETVAYRANLRLGKQLTQSGIDRMMQNDTPADASDDVIAILGSVAQGARAGYPAIQVPMGYSDDQRRALSVAVHGNAYSERDLIGVAYVIEQGTQKRLPASQVNPSMYRCADTVPAPPFSERGGCNPDRDTIMAMITKAPALDFALELESVEGLQARMGDRSLTAADLTAAYLARIAHANADGPAVQAVRVINPDALTVARALDKERRKDGPRGPLHGIPVIVDESIDVAGLPTTGGSIALQGSMPMRSAAVVRRLESAGAIILGKANITELNGLVDDEMPDGYSSLAGQVLLPSDTDKSPAGSSAGSAASTAAGFAAMAVGVETGPDAAQLVAPAERAGVVGLKPTVGLVSRAGILPAALSQDTPGPLARTVRDAAVQLQVIAGADPADPATAGAPAAPDYMSALDTDLAGTRIAVVASGSVPYANAVAALESMGATTVSVTIGSPSVQPPSVVGRELKRDLEAYLAGTTGPGPKTLQGIIAYNLAHPVEGLKYGQRTLVEAQAADLADPAQAATYHADLAAGRSSSRALIEAILANGTPADPADDIDAIVVPRGDELPAVAARAGYPALTVPAGEGIDREGRNPEGVTFVGTAFSEHALLSVGYALERGGPYVRRAPSITNPSMWRCVPGSAFFTAELCHPGDPLHTGITSTSKVPALPASPGQAPASPAQPATRGPKR